MGIEKLNSISCYFIMVFMILGLTTKALAYQEKDKNQEVFILDTLADYYNLSSATQLVEDKKGTLTINDFIDRKDIKFLSEYDKPLSSSSVYWCKVNVRNNLKDFTNWVLFPGFNNIIDIYIPNSTGSFIHKKAGQYIPASELEISHNKIGLIYLQLPENETVTVYFRLKNINHREIFAHFFLISPLRLNSDSQHYKLLDGIFQGIFFIMICYNMLLFFSNRDKTYLYYAGYVFSVAAYLFVLKSLGRDFIFSEVPTLEPYIWTLALGMAPVLYFQFIRSYLSTKYLVPRWDSYIRKMMIFVSVVMCINLIILLTSFNIPLVKDISIGTFVLEALFTFALLFRLYKTKNKVAFFLIIGSLSLVTATLLGVIFFVTDTFGYSFLTGQIGVVIEILLFSLGLGYRFKINEEEKRVAQEAYIEQLHENQSLQKKVNRELEHKVKERTHEIQEKNIELEQQNEEISAQRDLLEEKSKETQFQKQELEKKNVRLLELNEDKNHLIGIVAHDLRNPLTSALSMADLLQSSENDLDEDQVASLKLITKSMNRMNCMIERILDIKHVESNNIKVSVEKMAISPLILKAINSFENNAIKKDIKINHELIDVEGIIDPNYFLQVIENLISNAIKFSPKNKHIDIKLYKSNGKVRVEVLDQGPGICEDDMKKIFGKFQKLSAKPTAGEISTGLGLSIVKKFTNAMKGECWVESKNGSGATFILEFDS